jgi:uncharacterized protein
VSGRRPVRSGAGRLSLLTAALLLSGCPRPAEDPPELGGVAREALDFRTAGARIVTAQDTIHLRVEIAETAPQRSYGLMERAELPADAGMLFTYDELQPPNAGFWMFRTRIPLDIAYLGEDGEILTILQMDPCPSPAPQWCPAYEPGIAYRAALEVNRGYFQLHGIVPGDRVEVVPSTGG